MAPVANRTAPYFLLTFLITWGLQLPGVLAQRGLLGGAPDRYLALAGLGLFGPLLAATALSYREGGRDAVRKLYAQLLRWRLHPAWYALALLLPGALLTALLALLNCAGREGPITYLPAASGLGVGLVASLAEEIGWRGYALPRLQARFGQFSAGAWLGVLWYAWHLPMFLGLGVPLELALVMLLYFTGASLFMTWMYNGTQASLLVAVLAHLGAHLNNSHRALPGEVLPLLVHAIIYAGLGLLVMAPKLIQGRQRPGTPHVRPVEDRHTGAGSIVVFD